MDFIVLFGLLAFIVLMILFGATTGYVPALESATPTSNFGNSYAYFMDAHVVVFFGFGFLISFLYRSGVTAVGHGVMVAAFASLWGILNRGLWIPLIAGTPISKMEMTLERLAYGEFAAATVLVSFGALAGRVSAGQLLLLAILEVPIYTMNVGLSEGRYLTPDYGGSLQVFLFGAVFGLSCAFVMEAKASRWRPGATIRSTRSSDMSALMGTLFMWCFWPGFNSVVAPSAIRGYSITNTYLALAMGTMTTFTVQHVLWEGKFNMNEVQFATLAGGVAMGAASNWTVQPFGALLIGGLSSLLAVLGYRYVSPVLSRKLFINDTCGIINAFGIPGLAGGIAAVIAAGAGAYTEYPTTFGEVVRTRSPSRQGGFQLLLIATSISFPLVGGAITGMLLTLFGELQTYYDDGEEYVGAGSVEVPEVDGV